MFQKRVLPISTKFIQEHNNYEFWLLHIMPKRTNPTNVPKAKSIEEFWTLLSREVYSDDEEAKSVK